MQRRVLQSSKARLQSKLKAKFGTGSSIIGGKCRIRRKHKYKRKEESNAYKGMRAGFHPKPVINTNVIPGIEEVNLFNEDQTVLHFIRPSVNAEVSSNTFIIYGNYNKMELRQLCPEILSQINTQQRKKLDQSLLMLINGYVRKMEILLNIDLKWNKQIIPKDICLILCKYYNDYLTVSIEPIHQNMTEEELFTDDEDIDFNFEDVDNH